MASCKEDCLHYNVCYKKPIHAKNTDLDIMGGCSDFKNKADFQEVKHGEWVEDTVTYNDEFVDIAKCSLCGNGTPIQDLTPYCCRCGAKMDGGKNE